MPNEAYDWPVLAQKLISELRLQTTPIAFKVFENPEDMLAIPRIRTSKGDVKLHACQFFGQAARLNFTVGFTPDDLMTDQCRCVFGFKDRQSHIERTGLTNVWYATDADTRKHQAAMYTIPDKYKAAAISPLASGRIQEPDVCGIYCSPQQLCFIGCALQFFDYEPLEMTFVGESSCSDTWAKAFITGKPCASIPCYGERRFGGVLDNEMLIAFPPKYVKVIIKGLAELSKRGMRFPISYYGIQNDVRAGMAKNYSK